MGGESFEDDDYATYRRADLLDMGTVSTSYTNATGNNRFSITLGRLFSGQMFITNSDDVYQHRVEGIANESTPPAEYYHRTQAGGIRLNSESRVDYIRIFRDSGNFTSGTMRLYGLRNA